MLVMIKACVVPTRNEFPRGQLNELGWITYCQGCHVCDPQHQAEVPPRRQQDQHPVLLCLRGTGSGKCSRTNG